MLSLKLFWENIFHKQKKDTLTLLRENPLFADLTLTELIKIINILHHRKYAQHETIFHQKKQGAAMYIIKTGKVKLVVKNEPHKSEELAILEDNDFFGESTLFEESSRKASAIAIDETELFALFKEDLLNLMNRAPRIASKIIYNLSMVLSKRLDLIYENIKD